MEKPALETRLEKVLAKRAGEQVDFTSETRFEAFLNGEKLEPTTNLEYWIDQINQNGDAGGGINEVNVVFNIIPPEEGEEVESPAITKLVLPIGQFVDGASGDYFIKLGPDITKIYLYDGKEAYCFIQNTQAMINGGAHIGKSATIEGGAHFMTDDIIAITGDCTINITMTPLQT